MSPAGKSGAWVVAEGGEPDGPVLIRVRTDLGPAAGAKRWPNRLAVVWSCPSDGADHQGLPTSAQQTAMGRLEPRRPALPGLSTAVCEPR